MLLAAAAAYATETGAAHVVATVGGHEAERQRFFARMGFAPLTTRRIVAARVPDPVAGDLAAQRAHRAGAAPCAAPARRRRRPVDAHGAGGWAPSPIGLSAAQRALTRQVSRAVAVGRPCSSVTSIRNVASVRPTPHRRADGGDDAGRRRAQVAGVELDADHLPVRPGAQRRRPGPIVSTSAQVAPPCSRP